MDAIKPKQELEHLTSRYKRAYAMAASPNLFDVPNAGGWSAAQHLHHLALTNSSIARLIPALLSGNFGTETSESRTERLEELAQGYFPSGGRSPANLIPPDDLSEKQLKEVLDKSLKAVNLLEHETFRPSNKFDHIYYGPLDATQWLRFAQLHMKHHFKLIEAQR